MERSNEVVDAALNSPNNFANSTEFRRLNGGRGRKVGDLPSIPPLMRELIGKSAALGDEKSVVAETFGVCEKTVTRSEKGIIGNSRFDPELKEKVDEVKRNKREEVAEQALDALTSLFAGSLSPENLTSLKPMEAIVAGKGLAEIVERVAENKKEKANTQNNFVIFKPDIKDESEYPVVEIQSTQGKKDNEGFGE